MGRVNTFDCACRVQRDWKPTDVVFLAVHLYYTQNNHVDLISNITLLFPAFNYLIVDPIQKKKNLYDTDIQLKKHVTCT